MMFRKHAILLFIALTTASTAQVGPWFTDMAGGHAGETVLPFLKMPVSAAVLGQGTAASMGSMDATDIVAFPANTALFMGTRISITHLEWLMGLRNEFAGASFPVADAGVISVFSKVFTPGTWEGRDIDEIPVKPNAIDYAVGAGFARKFLDGRVAAGITAAYLESRLDDATGRGFLVNADVRAAPLDLVDVRIRMENLGPPITYAHTPEPLPFTMGAAVSVKPITRLVDLTDRFDFDVGLGALKAGDDPLVTGTRLGVTIVQRILVRAGYEYAVGRPITGIEGLSAGVGLRIDRYGFDFGWKDQSSALGMVWAASAHFQGEDIVPKTAKDFYLAAERNFNSKRYSRCVGYAAKALKLDPRMWQASTLIARANAEMRRKTGLEIALIYTGNYQGRFVPQTTPDGTMGGLARQATVLKTLRERFPVNITIDAGNTVGFNSSAFKAQIGASYYRRTGYDAIAPGSGEHAFGLPAYISTVRDSLPSLLCSNCREADHFVVTKEIIKRGRYAIAVFNVMQPRENIPEGANLLPAIEAMSHLLATPDAISSNLRVVVVHDSWENIRSFAQALPSVDVIICGEQAQPFETAMKAGSADALSVGSHGKYVGNYIIRFDDRGLIQSAENHLIPLTDNIPPDPQVAEMIRRMSVRTGLAADSIDERLLAKGSIDGVFCFTSNRDGAAGVFLKVADRNAEFPLTPAGQECVSPVTSPAGGHVAYLRTPAPAKPQELWVMNMAGLEQRRIEAAHPAGAVFTPDGQWLYFCASAGGKDTTTGICRIPAGGITPKVILDWPGSSEQDVSFSRDSQFMAFTSNRDSGKSHIYMTNPLGENPVKISEYKADHARPLFSPDGGALAYLSTYTGYRGKYDIWVYDRRTGKRTRVTQDSHVAEYCWLGDSRTIVYSSGVNLVDLNLVDVSTGNTRKLINTNAVKAYSETSPRSIMRKGVERILYVRDYQNGKRRVFWAMPDGSEDVPVVTDNGDAWLMGR